MSPLETYLKELRDVYSTGAGVAETSYYPALSNLFNEVGKTLKPKVRCVINLSNRGAGLPDGGLFTADQFQKAGDKEPKKGQPPSRGAIEAKGTKPDVRTIAASQQVKDYLLAYGIVVVTNLREFLIVQRGPSGEPVTREAFALAGSEKEFWQKTAAHPRAAADEQGGPFVEFILRACLHAAPLTRPKDAAWFLASYARDALHRVERQKDLPALLSVRTALEEALGMKFSEERGEHFFRSTLVQTLFYGVFAAWVRWHKDNPAPAAKFDWRIAEWSLHVPFIRTLYEEVAKASTLGKLGLVELLDWTAGVLNRVERGEFFKNFEDEHAVQYFYEPFLEAYDPELRKELGVWYTPPEIVKYQVARVDAVLREELDLPDGLADPNVIVLDPCCGTGAYLVEVLRCIERTQRDRHDDGLIGYDVKKAATSRVFGFEIMPAPFVIAHMQIGSLLQQLGVPLSSSKSERAAVYLTNALTGWERSKGPKQQIMGWAELQEERDKAANAKQAEILVVIGNPPYNAFAGVSPVEEKGLVEPYKKDLNRPASEGGWGIKKFNLDDLYIRFFRLAERRIAEMTGRGVVSFISNFSYLSAPSFVVMRQRFLAEFDKLWFDCMNGDSRETGKLTPDGKPDPSVFSTEYNREGIRVGTAVCVMVRKKVRDKEPTVFFRQFWGVDKRRELLATLEKRRSGFKKAAPAKNNRSSFAPESVVADYDDWPKLTELCLIPPFNGLMEKRAGALIDIERDDLETRMRDYFDAGLSWNEYTARQAALTEDAARCNAQEARAKATMAEGFDVDRLRRYSLRPFDTRWCYYTPVRPVWNEPRPALWAQCWPNNSFLMSRPGGVASPEGIPLCFTRALGDNDALRGHAYYLPLMLKNGARLERKARATLFAALGEPPEDDEPSANLSPAARKFLEFCKFKNADDPKTARLIWMHTLAIGYSPAYLDENADGIRRDWLRIPIPANRTALETSAGLGDRLAALLDSESDMPAATSGKIAPLLNTIGRINKTGGGPLDPNGDDFAITAGWGHAGKEGVTMPAKGKLARRQFNADEIKAIQAEAADRGMSADDLKKLLGGETCDVYLNDSVYWRNIPASVWEYYIGGYQVIKKWLSYRELELLGRSLKPEEAREVTNIARRLTATVLLQPALDENYRQVKAATYAWPKADT